MTNLEAGTVLKYALNPLYEFKVMPPKRCKRRCEICSVRIFGKILQVHEIGTASKGFWCWDCYGMEEEMI